MPQVIDAQEFRGATTTDPVRTSAAVAKMMRVLRQPEAEGGAVDFKQVVPPTTRTVPTVRAVNAI